MADRDLSELQRLVHEQEREAQIRKRESTSTPAVTSQLRPLAATQRSAIRPATRNQTVHAVLPRTTLASATIVRQDNAAGIAAAKNNA